MGQRILLCSVFVCGLLGCSDEAIPLEDMGTVVQDNNRGDAFLSSMGDVGVQNADAVINGDGEADERAQEISVWADDVDELIERMGQFVAENEPNDGVIIGEPEEAPEPDGSNFTCTTQSMSKTTEFTEYVATQVNSNALWVGALVSGQNIESGLLTEVVLPRTPVEISVDLENLEGTTSATMDDPSLSAYREALRGVLDAGVNGATDAQVTFSAEEIYSEEQLNVVVGSNVSVGNVDVSAGFDFSRNETRSRVLITFVQAYYTVDMNAFGRASDFFEPLTDRERIRDAFGGSDARAPAYVSSITYGRRVFFTAESTASASELKAALDFAYDGVGADVEVNARLSHEEVLNESRIQAFIVGGNGEDAVGAVNGLAGIREYIEACGNLSSDCPGAPIAYKLNYLSDNRPARLSLTTDYQKQLCLRVRQNVQVTLRAITPRGGQNNPETYGKVAVESFNVDGTRARRDLLFDKSKQERISMTKNGRWQPSNVGTSTVLPAVAEPGAAGAKIRIEIRLKEQDDLANDDDVNGELVLQPSAGWRHGCGHGEELVVTATHPRQNYDVSFCLVPMPD